MIFSMDFVEVFTVVKKLMRPIAFGVFMLSAFLIIILRKPKKIPLIEIDESTDKGKILMASRYAKNLLILLEKLGRKYIGIEFGEILTNDGNNAIRIGKKSTTIQELILEKMPELQNAVWQVTFADPDIDYGTYENMPVAAVVYTISDSYIGSYPFIPENEKDLYKGKLAECLAQSREISLGTNTVISDKDDEKPELIDDDNEPTPVL